MTPKMFRKIKSVLDQRQTDLTIVMENAQKPRNLAAIVRTCDAVGLYEVHQNRWRSRLSRSSAQVISFRAQSP